MDSKQSSDAANSGVHKSSYPVNSPNTPAPKPTATSPSGSSQSHNRGKQG